ncbi:hypothetical protein LZ30DRAFT_771766 [Colletotrichum cereale]|nr:hypothetical protein LZ30DRAFT_771766 [Colletotrichum cereale]
MCGCASTTGGERENPPPVTPSQPSAKRARLSSAAVEPVFGRLEVTADFNSDDIIHISSKRLGETRSVVDHISDDTFAIRGPRDNKATFTCVARFVADTEKAVPAVSTPPVARSMTHGLLRNDVGEAKTVPAPELDGPVLSRGSLDTTLEKWSAWGRPNMKLKLLIDEMTSIEPQARSVELLVTQEFADKNPEMSVVGFDSMLSTERRRCYDWFAEKGKTQIGKDITRFKLLVFLWAVSGNSKIRTLWESLGEFYYVDVDPDDSTFPWNKLKPSETAGGHDLLYESFLQKRNQKMKHKRGLMI